MHRICKKCGFEGDCISAENDLCAKCDEDIRQCEICKLPCRTIEEQTRKIGLKSCLNCSWEGCTSYGLNEKICDIFIVKDNLK